MLAKFLPIICLCELYFAYFHSHIVYSMLSWYPLLSANCQNVLITLQKKIVRSVCNVPYRQHCVPLFKKNGILRLEDQIILEGNKHIHRIVNDNCPIPIVNLCQAGIAQLVEPLPDLTL